MKYGMKYSTIRYYQKEGQWLHLHTGWPYPQAMNSVYDVNSKDARTIAYDMIRLAAAHIDIKDFLRG